LQFCTIYLAVELAHGGIIAHMARAAGVDPLGDVPPTVDIGVVVNVLDAHIGGWLMERMK
jgi:hypothetical protein